MAVDGSRRPAYPERYVPTFDLYEELRAVAAAFEAADLDHAFCGGVALAVHGHPRATTDLDVLMLEASVEEAKRLLAAIGYRLEAAPMEFTSGIRVHRVSRVEGADLMTVDILVAAGVLDGPWEGRERIPWGDGAMRVVSRDGLIAMKRLAGRAQDLADLEALGVGDE